MSPIRTAILGFGTAGRVFHAPFVAADPRYALSAIVTRDDQRRADAAARHPEARLVDTPDELDPADLDLVVVATPPGTHAELAGAFLDAGVGVVVDKPFTVTAAEGRDLIAKAQQRNVPLTVFQNRRWDGDFQTVGQLIAAGELGDVWRFESRFEWWKPARNASWKVATPVARGGGILYDLGPHLIDQALRLFGPAEPVYHEINTRRDGGTAPDDAFVVLQHESGVRSQLWMNGLAAQVGPRFRVLGSRAAFTKHGLDPQEPTLIAGAQVTDPDFGVEPESSWGRLGVDGATRPVPTVRGNYAEFYAILAEAVQDGGPLPVDPADAVRVIELIQRLHESAES